MTLPAAFLFLAVLAVSPAFGSGGNAAVSPEDSLELLKKGNERFVSGACTHPRGDASRREQTAKEGQKPFATVVGCSDSRSPIELIFDQGIGDIFVVRIAGNVSGTDEIGSVEYGVGHLGTALVVVLGHTRCGAVTAAASGAQVHGSTAALIQRIRPAVETARKKTPAPEGDALVAAAIEANVWRSIEDLLRGSAEIREKVREGKVKIVGALFDLFSGRVTWLGSHPGQGAFLSAASPEKPHAPTGLTAH
jgi:carbonic anhydrase